MTQFDVMAAVEAVKILVCLRENSVEADRLDRAQRAKDAVRVASNAIMAVVGENPSDAGRSDAEIVGNLVVMADSLYEAISH
jgi:hypothetical protein